MAGDRFTSGSYEETRRRLSAGSQSEQSEQYESSLAHGDGERACRRGGEGGVDGERVSCGSSDSIGGVVSLRGGVSFNVRCVGGVGATYSDDDESDVS